MRPPMPTLEGKLLFILKVKQNDSNLKTIYEKFPNITKLERCYVIDIYQTERTRMIRNNLRH
jgi:hypothetical protein